MIGLINCGVREKSQNTLQLYYIILTEVGRSAVKAICDGNIESFSNKLLLSSSGLFNKLAKGFCSCSDRFGA